MISGRLEESQTYRQLLSGNVWKVAFDALKALTPSSPLGVTSLELTGVTINVHTYETLPVDRCVWESHDHTIDLQYIIEGSEFVDYEPTVSLGTAISYNAEKERYEYAATGGRTRLYLSAGRWAVFFPEDGHRPKIRTGDESTVLKAVVKIDREALSA